MFSQASEYALRALTELAKSDGQEWVLAHDLALRLGVPVHYLAKVLQTLARRGVLSSQRGRQGGFRLARSPKEVTAWDIVELLDDARKLDACVMGETQCLDEDPCPLHHIWTHLKRRFVEELKSATLHDLAAFDRTITPPMVCEACRDRTEALPGRKARVNRSGRKR